MVKALRCRPGDTIGEGSSLGLALGENSLPSQKVPIWSGILQLSLVPSLNLIVEFLLTPIHCLARADIGSVCARLVVRKSRKAVGPVFRRIHPCAR